MFPLLYLRIPHRLRYSLGCYNKCLARELFGNNGECSCRLAQSRWQKKTKVGEGNKLLKYCESRLKEAEIKIEQLKKERDGVTFSKFETERES